MLSASLPLLYNLMFFSLSSHMSSSKLGCCSNALKSWTWAAKERTHGETWHKTLKWHLGKRMNQTPSYLLFVVLLHGSVLFCPSLINRKKLSKRERSFKYWNVHVFWDDYKSQFWNVLTSCLCSSKISICAFILTSLLAAGASDWSEQKRNY